MRYERRSHARSSISIQARISWPPAMTHRVKRSFFSDRAAGQPVIREPIRSAAPFAFDFIRWLCVCWPKTCSSGCVIWRPGSLIFPRNVCTMTRRMPLVHFHRRVVHARTTSNTHAFEIRSRKHRENSTTSISWQEHTFVVWFFFCDVRRITAEGRSRKNSKNG